MLDNDTIDALVNGNHADPFAVLGMHETGDGLAVRAWLPGAVSAAVIDRASGRAVAALERIDARGLFAGAVPRRRNRFAYRLRVDWGTHTQALDDAYRFGPVLGDMDVWLLGEGTHRRPYEVLGAHPMELDGVAGVHFAVWAPNAQRV